MSETGAFVELAERMADAVRPIVLECFREGVAFDVKDDRSPVTQADRDAEETMRRLIAERFPGHGILGEEFGPSHADADYVWVLDPIDGTKSFITGKPLFGTLIALVYRDRPVVGVIDMPALDERWTGAKGRATTWNGRAVRVRPCPALDGAWLYATSPQMFEGDDDRAFTRLRGDCYATVFGADCYAYGLLARGRVDIVCEASLKAYDYCAVVPVVEGAGGMITDWQGRPLGLASDGRVVAAGDPSSHAAARAALGA
jgi:inositol-phosphate phosphatase/L-galactose 1-phosphate phosphatase/histidinol-phosphatase